MGISHCSAGDCNRNKAPPNAFAFEDSGEIQEGPPDLELKAGASLDLPHTLLSSPLSLSVTWGAGESREGSAPQLATVCALLGAQGEKLGQVVLDSAGAARPLPRAQPGLTVMPPPPLQRGWGAAAQLELMLPQLRPHVHGLCICVRTARRERLASEVGPVNLRLSRVGSVNPRPPKKAGTRIGNHAVSAMMQDDELCDQEVVAEAHLQQLQQSAAVLAVFWRNVGQSSGKKTGNVFDSSYKDERDPMAASGWAWQFHAVLEQTDASGMERKIRDAIVQRMNGPRVAPSPKKLEPAVEESEDPEVLKIKDLLKERDAAMLELGALRRELETTQRQQKEDWQRIFLEQRQAEAAVASERRAMLRELESLRVAVLNARSAAGETGATPCAVVPHAGHTPGDESEKGIPPFHVAPDRHMACKSPEGPRVHDRNRWALRQDAFSAGRARQGRRRSEPWTLGSPSKAGVEEDVDEHPPRKRHSRRSSKQAKQIVAPDNFSTVDLTIFGGEAFVAPGSQQLPGFGPNPYPWVKVLVDGKREVFQTEVQRDTLDPAWNAACTFKVGSNETFVTLKVLDHSRPSMTGAAGIVDADARNSMGSALLQLTLLPQGGMPLEFWLDVLGDDDPTPRGRLSIRACCKRHGPNPDKLPTKVFSKDPFQCDSVEERSPKPREAAYQQVIPHGHDIVYEYEFLYIEEGEEEEWIEESEEEESVERSEVWHGSEPSSMSVQGRGGKGSANEDPVTGYRH